MSQALAKIVDKLISPDHAPLSDTESLIVSLIETIADTTEDDVLKSFIHNYKRERLNVGGRVRFDLLAIARAIRVNILAQARTQRQVPIVDIEKELQKLREAFS